MAVKIYHNTGASLAFNLLTIRLSGVFGGVKYVGFIENKHRVVAYYCQFENKGFQIPVRELEEIPVDKLYTIYADLMQTVTYSIK